MTANEANCLTKNLLEMESLPQIRNLLEMREISSAAKVSGGVKDEVNDEGTKAHRGGHRRAIPTGAEEREDGNSERVCGGERVRAQLCGAGFWESRPGTLLKHQIPLRTFSEWDEQQPGFLEIDLVGHDGGVIDSLHAFTLNATDVATGWTVCVALKNKAQVWSFAGLQKIRAKLPFPLLGIDSDNGSEFINESFFRYCQDEKITFTRSRPYRKNDSCFVEQKNYSVVRRAVGYQRCDTDEQLRLLAELYAPLELYTNFFQPSMKLKSKERHGARVTKKYDKARPPYQRVLESSFIDEQTKEQLRQRYELLNPAQLKRQLERWQRKLLATAARPRRSQRRLATKRRAALRPAVEMPRLRKATKSVASLSRLEKSAQKGGLTFPHSHSH